MEATGKFPIAGLLGGRGLGLRHSGWDVRGIRDLKTLVLGEGQDLTIDWGINRIGPANGP